MPFKDYKITSNRGWRAKHPVTGKRAFHAGIDLVKSHKAPITAFLGGKVLYAGDGKSGTGVGGYGNVVVIEDSKGAAHVYAHLDSVSVKKGQTVSKGDTIGRQGMTGQVTGSHLHYEIRKKCVPSLGWTSNQESSTYDPKSYLQSFSATTSNKGRVNPKYPKRYDTGVSVSVWQQKLKDLGYYKGKVDDSFGPETEKATKAFQSDHNLKADGQAGPKSNAAADKAIKNKKSKDLEWVGTNKKGRRVVSIYKGKEGLNFYDGPRWNNPSGTFGYGEGWKVDNLYRVNGSLMYRVQNSKGDLYWITASSKYVKVK